MKELYFGQVVNGKVKLHPGQRELMDAKIALLDGCQVELTIERKRKHSSDGQRKYYHAVVVKMLADHIGNSKKAMHEELKALFLTVKGENGKPDEIRSTESLGNEEYQEYLHDIRTWAREFHNLNIPEPGEVQI